MLIHRKIKLKNTIGNVYQYKNIFGLDSFIVVENSALRYIVDNKLHQGDSLFDAQFSLWTGKLKTINNIPIK